MDSLILLAVVGAIGAVLVAASVLAGNTTAHNTKIRWKKDKTIESGEITYQ